MTASNILADQDPTFWATVTFSDVAIIFATLLGPVLAVQAQKFLERRREESARREWIFRTLMATRAAMLSRPHVEALNAIPVEFYGSKRAFKEVVVAWKTYLDHLCVEGMEAGVWGDKRYEYFIALLVRLSKALGYNFSEVELKREIYSPKGHAQIEQEEEIIRQGLSRLFKGETALPMEVKTSDPDALARQVQIQEKLLKWLEGEGKVRVEWDKEKPAG